MNKNSIRLFSLPPETVIKQRDIISLVDDVQKNEQAIQVINNNGVVTDGITITGNGTSSNPLIAQIPPAVKVYMYNGFK